MFTLKPSNQQRACTSPPRLRRQGLPLSITASDLRRHSSWAGLNHGPPGTPSIPLFATMDVRKKHEIEAALATETLAISAGQLKEENPLDLSQDFRIFCEACRRGDLKVCQELISTGVNINARDKFDYTPLILVRYHTPFLYLVLCTHLHCAEC